MSEPTIEQWFEAWNRAVERYEENRKELASKVMPILEEYGHRLAQQREAVIKALTNAAKQRKTPTPRVTKS